MCPGPEWGQGSNRAKRNFSVLSSREMITKERHSHTYIHIYIYVHVYTLGAHFRGTSFGQRSCIRTIIQLAYFTVEGVLAQEGKLILV
jgi:hypothetical protein